MSNWGMCILILLFIFSPVLSTQETAQPGAAYVIAIVVPAFIIAIKNGLIRPQIINIYAVLLFVFEIISTLLSDLSNPRLGTHLKYLFLIIFFISTSSIVLTSKQLKYIFKSYLGLSIIISVLIILSFYFGYPHNSSEFYQGRYSVGITGVFKNPNYLTYFYNIAFFVICYILSTVKLDFKKKLVLYSILGMFVVSSFFTGTRAALLVEILIIISMIFVLSKKRRLYTIIWLAIIIAGVVVYYWSTLQDLYDLFMGGRELAGDTGREDAWNLAIKYIKNNPIFGCGHNSWYKIHGSSYLEWLHNVFLELILDQGLIGFILFIGILTTGFKKTNPNDRVFLLLFLCFSTIPMIFQNGLYEVHFWRYIIMNRLLMNYSSSYDGGINSFLQSAFGTTHILQVREAKAQIV